MGIPKENYFEDPNWRPVVVREPKASLEPSTAALLVLDMQQYFLDPGSHAYIPAASSIVPRIERLQRAFLEKELFVLQTRHLNRLGDAGQMSQWWRELIAAENPLSRLTHHLENRRVSVLLKSQYDAFYNTSLEDDLKQRGITQVLITGVMTHLCCETTARSAFMRGFRVYFVNDAVASYNRAFHDAAVLNLSHGFAAIVSAAGIIQQIQEFHNE